MGGLVPHHVVVLVLRTSEGSMLRRVICVGVPLFVSEMVEGLDSGAAAGG